MEHAKEVTRQALAEFLRVTPEEIVITRNTSESSNLVSSGLDLKAGDDVLLFSDNHPSNSVAWKEKAKRYGYRVNVVPAVNPHPGPEYYLDAFTKALTPQTKVLAFTHLTSTVGDLFPARELCRLARERGILTLVDGAQSFGLMDVDLREMDPDFYAGSGHKWPCGPKEAGVLFINRRSASRIWPSIYSAYPGAVGHLEDLRELRTAGRARRPGLRRSAPVPDEDRPGRHRGSRPGAGPGAHGRLPQAPGGEGVDARRPRALGGRGVLAARHPRPA